MIRMRVASDGCFEPCFCCETCGGRIDDARAAIVIYFSDPIPGCTVEALIVHKGFCDQKAQHYRQAVRFMELSYAIELLSVSTKRIPAPPPAVRVEAL